MKKFLSSLIGALTLCGCAVSQQKITLPPGAVLLDVRSDAEFARSHIKGAIVIPHDQISGRIEKAVPDKNTPLYIYCRSGRRVKIAIETLKTLGYTALHDLGGMDEAVNKLENAVKEP